MAKDPKAGRPEFEATEARRDKVEWYIACGMTEDEVAAAIGCSTPTLQKHFAHNILTGRSRKRAEIIDLWVATAKKGNATIQKHLGQVMDLAAAEAAFDRPQKSGRPEEKPEKLGKKEQANLAAETAGAGTSWGDDLQAPPSKQH